MADTTPFSTETTDTVDIITQSVYHVLREHGYANPSIAKIADEAGLSKSALYDHYEGNGVFRNADPKPIAEFIQM